MMRQIFFIFLALAVILPVFANAQNASTSTAILYRPLYVSTAGDDVSYLQTFLKEKGFFTYPLITGFFGAFTWQAVADFQSANNLERVGVVGPRTRALINSTSISANPGAQNTPTISGVTPPSVATTYCPFVFCPTGDYSPGFGGGGGVSSQIASNTDTDGMPTNATLQLMLDGTTGSHSATPHGVPSGYDWYAHGRMGDGVTPAGGRTYLMPWGQVFLAAGQTIDTDDVIEVANLRLYIKSISTGLWTEIRDDIRVTGALYPEDYDTNATPAIAATPYSVSPNPIMVKLESNRAFHFYSSSRYLVPDVSDLAAAIVSFDVRILSASGADVSGRNTRYIAGTGLDWWSASSGGTNRDAFVGQMTYVTPESRKKYGTTMTTLANLQAVRPPSNLEQLTGSYTAGVDANYVSGAFAQYMARAGTTVDATRTQIYKDFYDTLAAESGLLSSLNAIYIFASVDATLALQNLVGDTLNASSSATHTPDDGIAGNGSSTYVDTTFNPEVTTNHFTQNSAYIGTWLNTSAQHTTSPLGWYDGTDGVTITPRTAANEISVRINQAAATVSSTGGSFTDGRGYVSGIRDGASSVRIRKSGSTVATSTTVSTAVNVAPLRVGSIGGSLYNSSQVRLLVIGSALTDQQDAVLANAAATMFTAIDALP